MTLVANPVEGGRVYDELTTDLDSLPSTENDSWSIAEQLRATIQDNLGSQLAAGLASEEVDALGFEVGVSAESFLPGGYPDVDGAVGLSVLWLTNSSASPNPVQDNPHPHVFATSNQGDPARITDTPDPASGMVGSFFVAHYGGDDEDLTPDNWARSLAVAGVDAAGASGGLADGSFTAFALPDEMTFLWGNYEVWWVSVANLAIQETGSDLQVEVSRSDFMNTRWLLGQLGLIGPSGMGGG